MKKQLKVKRLLIEFVIVCLCGFILKCEESVLPSNQQNPNQDQNTNHSDIWYQTGMDYIDGDYSQGVATDGKYWYFTHKEKIYKTTSDYNVVAINEFAIPQFLLDQGYEHIGDIDYYEGKIYAPMEDVDRVSPLLCIYDTTNLTFSGEYYPLNGDGQTHGPWIAVDPETNLIYTSEFSDVNWLNIYTFYPEDGFDFVQQIALGKTITHVQGGVFYNGFLYLACDCGGYNGNITDNIYRVDITTGEVRCVINIENIDELEGIDAYEMGSGILHIMSETKADKNKFYHYSNSDSLAHNLRISAVKSPGSNPSIFRPLNPSITVHNIGVYNEQNVDVYCVIMDSLGNEIYWDDQIISNVMAYNQVIVQFASWVPTEGKYTCVFYTELASDLETDNDTVRFNIEVSNIIDDFDNNLEKWDTKGGWALSIGQNNTNGLASSPRPYANNTDNAIRYLTHFNLESVNSASVGFWTKNRLEDGKDFLFVEASTDKVNWSQVGSLTGQQLSWVQTFCSLESFCGEDSVYIRFRLVTDDNGTDSGIRIDDVGLYSGIVSSVNEKESLPQTFALLQNYPNPFNPTTKISYDLSQSGSVNLKIYNISGQEVRTIVSGYQQAGSYIEIWDGTDNQGNILASGVYAYKLEVDGFHETMKMLFVK